jgi:cellulose synthase/poly-beta-1,6-N-acetylglucosamine synthase-like glycosyltransferase
MARGRLQGDDQLGVQRFFQIGMVHRNERNAIIQHGTMTLIRKSALIDVGRWGEWCICEDAELGLRLLQGGHESVYVNHNFGKGFLMARDEGKILLLLSLPCAQ